MSEDELRSMVEQWLRFAAEDLDAARRTLRDGYPARHTCWAAQQAAEKALKALLMARELSFPKTHSLRVLNQLLLDTERAGETDFELDALSRWAIESRYPGPWPEMSAADAQNALAVAERVFQHVSLRLIISS